MLTKGGKLRRKAKPTVHQDLICTNPSCQNSFEYCFQMGCRFGYSLLSPFVPTAVLIQLLLDSLSPFVGLCRRTQEKVQRQETGSVRPSMSQQFKSLEAFTVVMVIISRQQLHNFGAGAVVGVIIKNQYVPTLVTCQYIKEPDTQHNHSQHEFSTIMLWIPEKIVGDIVLKFQCRGCQQFLG